MRACNLSFKDNPAAGTCEDSDDKEGEIEDPPGNKGGALFRWGAFTWLRPEFGGKAACATGDKKELQMMRNRKKVAADFIFLIMPLDFSDSKYFDGLARFFDEK